MFSILPALETLRKLKRQQEPIQLEVFQVEDYLDNLTQAVCGFPISDSSVWH
jgi:hypothetical protein